jgi:hypothetical protein
MASTHRFASQAESARRTAIVANKILITLGHPYIGNAALSFQRVQLPMIESRI